ncbi:MAG: cation transporter [Elusimicrobia bacterium]|nr:cation transporter [Candidatus Obscuribacterium magneticum]
MINPTGCRPNMCGPCGRQGKLLSTINLVALALLKGWAGWLGGSLALFSDALYSGSELILDFSRGLTTAQEKTHMKNGIIGSAIVFFAFLALFLSIKRLFFPVPGMQNPPRLWALAVALISVFSNFLVAWFIRCPAEKLASAELEKISARNRSEAMMSALVAGVILLSQFRFPEIDALGALLMGLMMIRMASNSLGSILSFPLSVIRHAG